MEPTGSGGGGQLRRVVLVTVVLVLDVVVVSGTLLLVVVGASEVVVVVSAIVEVVHCGMGAVSWLVPGRLTAPGPGRSPAASTVALKVGGMQKTLARVAACAAPSSMHTPAGDPAMLILRAGPCPKAPEFRCRHLVKAPVVHWLSAVQGCAGVSKLGENCWPQKPQKTKDCEAKSVEVALDVPVVSAKGMGRLPMNALDAGGQSWLVG